MIINTRQLRHYRWIINWIITARFRREIAAADPLTGTDANTSTGVADRAKTANSIFTLLSCLQTDGGTRLMHKAQKSKRRSEI